MFTYEFYDGPESGVAETPDGNAYRFVAIGESRYRSHRAYLIDHLTGGISIANGDQGRDLTNAEWLVVRELPGCARYVSISDLWLRCLIARRLGENDSCPGTDVTLGRC
jgi:hypothetical protein